MLVCNGVWAGELNGTGNGLSDASGAGQKDPASDLETPGLFIPVLLESGGAGFYYSSQNSDNILLSGGDVIIIPRIKKSPGHYDDRVIIRFDGQNSQNIPHGENPYSGKANFFIGNTSSQWRTEVPIYHTVAYQEIYPGIHLTYSDGGGQLKSEFVVMPAANPDTISYSYEWSPDVRIDESGALVIVTEKGGKLVEAPPEAYQVIGGSKIRVPVRYHLSDDYHVGFVLSAYDTQYPLIIDPEIITSGFAGGEVEDVGKGITIDDKGNIYIVGYTHSTDFPVTRNAFNETAGGYHDIFVTAYTKNGEDVLFSTFIGGAANDYARAVAVDSNGTLYITGSTECPDFPVKSAFQSKLQGKYDAFITAVRPGGAELAFSSYLGGNDIDDAFGIAMGGPENQIYLTGTTQSQDFPVLNAFQKTNAGQYDVFLTVLNSSGKNLAASTFLGGRQDDYGRAIALDEEGNIYIGGYTYSSKSSDFPVKNALFGPHTMTYDAFASKFRPDTKDLIYSTYIGGSMGDRVSAIALDHKNQIYMTGYTFADNFPVTADAVQRKYGGNLLADAFVIGLASDGQSTIASTYLGGSNDDMGYGIAIGDDGTIFVTGGTMSPDFPVSNAWQKNLNGPMNAFVSGLDPSGNRLIISSYLGGEGADLGASIAYDSNNLLYITGTTGSKQFPVVPPGQTNYHGDDDAFLAIISPGISSGGNTNMIIPKIPSLYPASENWKQREGNVMNSIESLIYCLTKT